MQQGFAYAWSVTQGDAPYSLPVGTITNAQNFNFVAGSVGNYVLTVVVTDKDGAATSSTQALTVTGMDANAIQRDSQSKPSVDQVLTAGHTSACTSACTSERKDAHGGTIEALAATLRTLLPEERALLAALLIGR
jgi:hypothetical protein